MPGPAGGVPRRAACHSRSGFMPVALLTERLCLVAEPIVDLRAGRRVGEELLPVISSSDHDAPQPFWERFDLDR